MNMSREHLTDTEIKALRRGGLEPAQLLDVTDHLAACAACQGRVLPTALLSSGITNLQNQFERHLTDEELIASVDGVDLESAAQTNFVRGHLNRCEACRSELNELREFRNKVHPPSMTRNKVPKWAALIAAAVLIAVVFFLVWPRDRETTSVEALPQPPAAEPARPSLPPAYQAMIDEALASRELERSPALDRLIRREGQLLGSASTGRFEVISPAGIVTASDRPMFRWQAVPGANDYVVSIYDTDFHKVAESGKLMSPSWQPDVSLTRGARLSWRVVARIGDRVERFPEPPAPEAVFEVMNLEAANEIDRVRQMQGSSPVLLALLYAQAGALDDAESELQRALQSSSASPELQFLAESLKKLQESQTIKRIR
jgi:hypothetical protein